jgi:nicotinate phosphoribosyltransferase
VNEIGKMGQSAYSPVLLTDLYELTMAATYYRQKMFASATFSLFIRKYPPHRAYFVSAGLDEILDFLTSLNFSQDDLDYLDTTGRFTHDFLHYLSQLRFTGEVLAIPEGRVFFRDEPILEITAPIIEAQLVETYVINALNLQVSVATKASRCVHAAQGRSLVDFSLRRTQGAEAGLKVARTSFIVGFSGTSNVLAGKLYNIPIFGTMAHSYITSFENEIDAFRAFSEAFPEDTVLLIDTYDNITGARNAAQVGEEMAERGQKLKGLRLDSGNMAKISKEVRAFLDQRGLQHVSIFASGGFDEFKIARVLEEGAEIDAFGVGTKMGVSADAPYTDMAYKLVKYGERPVLKLSAGKRTLVDEKQVFREKRDGKLIRDIICLRNQKGSGEPLLKPVMRHGERTEPPETLEAVRSRFREEFEELGDRYKAITDPEQFPVELSEDLKKLQEEIVHVVKEKELGES